MEKNIIFDVNSPLKTARTHITSFISKELKSRQEEIPLVGKFIDCANCEPLHMKNNTVKEMFMKVLNAVLTRANISSDIKRYKELPAENLFYILIMVKNS